MSIQDLTVLPREICGKEETGRLRRQGFTPCVVYGLGGESIPVSVEPKAVNKILRSEKGLNTVLNLRMKDTDQTRYVMIKSVDRHPINDRLLHIDFLRVDMDKPITVTIPVHVTGTPAGVKLGGILTIVRHEIEVTAKPADVPASIEIDGTNIGLDEPVRIGDLPKSEGVEFALGPKRMVAVIHAPDSSSSIDDEDDDEEAEA